MLCLGGQGCSNEVAVPVLRCRDAPHSHPWQAVAACPDRRVNGLVSLHGPWGTSPCLPPPPPAPGMGRDLSHDPGALGVDAKPGNALGTWSMRVQPSYLGGGHSAPTAHLPSIIHTRSSIPPFLPPCTSPTSTLSHTIPPALGEEITSKSILWDPRGWRKDLLVLMEPWGRLWAQLASFPKVLG